MAKEIERKFLVKGESWKQGEGSLFRQGYLSTDPERTIRVRIADHSGFLTIKGLTRGASRLEFEYEIPLPDADEMLNQLCSGPIIEKRRYLVPVADVIFEIDEFLGENNGLIVAEVELQREDQTIPIPDWLGPEVTDDPRYFNANLVRHPFSRW